MKINFNSLDLILSGGNRTIFEISNRLVERGHKVTITAIGSPQDSKWFSPIKAEVRYKKVTFAMNLFRKFYLRYRWNYDVEDALIRLMPDCDINVAGYCFTAYPTFFSGIGRPFYLIQHYEPYFFQGTARARLRERAKLTYFLPMRKLVVSRWLKDAVDKFGGEGATYIGNGVNTDVFRPSNVERDSYFRVMAFFRGIEWKGEDTILRALDSLSKEIRLKLIAVGSGKIGNVRFPVESHGVVTDQQLAELYSSSDVFVFASRSEGFGLPPLEAMACGTAVVTTDCCGVNEYAKNEYNAVVAKETGRLGEAIERIYEDGNLRDRLRIGGFETVRQYDMDRVVDRVETVFSEALR
jgi:glycosyltransferase involved in cell wall biosynthesis